MTDTRATQLLVEVLDVIPAAPVSASQLAAEVLLAIAPNEARVTDLLCELIVLPLTVSAVCPADFRLDPD